MSLAEPPRQVIFSPLPPNTTERREKWTAPTFKWFPQGLKGVYEVQYKITATDPQGAQVTTHNVSSIQWSPLSSLPVKGALPCVLCFLFLCGRTQVICIGVVSKSMTSQWDVVWRTSHTAKATANNFKRDCLPLSWMPQQSHTAVCCGCIYISGWFSNTHLHWMGEVEGS